MRLFIATLLVTFICPSTTPSIQEVRIDSIDVRRRCQRKDNRMEDFKLEPASEKPSKQEIKNAQGYVTMQFNDCARYASPSDKDQGSFLYPGDMVFWKSEAQKIDRKRRDKASEMAIKLAKAREDFAV